MKLAQGEREAREYGFKEETSRRAEDRRAAAAGELLAAVTLLSQSGFETDSTEHARLRVLSARHLAQSAVYLEPEDDAFLRWVGIELEDIGDGLNDRDLLRKTPKLSQEIQWKCGHLINFIMAWLKRVCSPDLFADLPHIALENTVRSKGFRKQT